MKLGFIGCGIISIAHVEGLEELRRKELETFDLSAVCDIQQERAEEDTAVTVFKFKNGGLGHWMCATSTHGEGTGGVWVYGNKGCLRPGQHITLEDGNKILMSDLIERYAPDIVEHPFAHSYVELWEAIAENKTPISSAEKGLEALSVVFAALESATIGQPVKVQDILNGKKHAYEDTVFEEMQLPV